MEATTFGIKNNRLFYFFLLFDLAMILVWVIGQNIDVYRYALVGALYELFWLTMLATIFFMPLIALFFWYRDKFSTKSKFLLLLLFSVLTLVGFYYFKGM